MSLDQAIAEIAASQLEEGPPDTLERAVNRLLHAGIRKVSDLERAANENRVLAARFAKIWMNGTTYERLSIGIGTLYLAYVLMAAKQDRSAFIQYLNQFNIGDTGGRDEAAERAIAIFNEVNAQ